MAKQSLLVADADPRSLRILDVALRKAGFQVATASDGAEALRRIQRSPPDLLLADVALPGQDGVALCKSVREDPRLAGTPVILISSSKEASLKLSAHEAGADDFLGKPLLIKELTTRIRMLLTRREQQKMAQHGSDATLNGSIGEMGLVDLFQSLDANSRSAVIFCEEGERTAQIWVRNGQVVDAEAGALLGEAAFYRALGWETGTFRAEFGPVDREARITQGTQALLAESVRRVDELQRLGEELPLSTVLSIDFTALARRLADLPDEVNGVIRLCDGQRTISQVMDRAPVDELSVLAILQRLLGERVLLRVSPAAVKSKPSLLQWLGPDSVATPAPPIMGAHGFPQASDPTPIAPPVSDPPLSQTVMAAAVPVLPTQIPIAPAPEAPARRADDRPRMTPIPGGNLDALRPVTSSIPPPMKTDMFKLPVVPKAAVPLVRFAPLRGVRRDRLRHEADEARARVADGKPVRLTHVVELPVWPAGPGDSRRRISPAVGEAAKKFAPDLPVGQALGGPEEEPPPVILSPDEMVSVPEIPDTEPSPPPSFPAAQGAVALAQGQASSNDNAPLAQPHADDRDQFVESATMQVEPLSSDALAGSAAVPLPASPQPAPSTDAQPSTDASAKPSPWEERTQPAAPEPHAAVTSPGYPIGAVAEPSSAAAEVAKHETPTSPTSPEHSIDLESETPLGGIRIPMPSADSPRATQMQPEPTVAAEPAIEPAPIASAPVALARIETVSARRELLASPHAVTAEYSPVNVAPPATAASATSADDEFDAEMRAALGKNKRRWPLFAALGVVVIGLVIFFRPQPPTDKKDAPWLEKGVDKSAGAAVAPALVPTDALAVDAGVAEASADAGAIAAADAGPAVAVVAQPDAPVDAGNDASAIPSPDEYARALASGEALLKRGKYRPAVVELKKAVALNPESVPALLELGDAYLEADQPRSALKHLEKAARLDSKSSRAQLLLGTAWQSLGKVPDAVKSYQRYLDMDPSGEYARDVRSILANLQK